METFKYSLWTTNEWSTPEKPQRCYNDQSMFEDSSCIAFSVEHSYSVYLLTSACSLSNPSTVHSTKPNFKSPFYVN